jgi:hypothetical protein
MMDSKVDPLIEIAMVSTEKMIRSYADQGGNVVEFFAPFAGIVLEQDKEVGLRCLKAADAWISKKLL